MHTVIVRLPVHIAKILFDIYEYYVRLLLLTVCRGWLPSPRATPACWSQTFWLCHLPGASCEGQILRPYLRDLVEYICLHVMKLYSERKEQLPAT